MTGALAEHYTTLDRYFCSFAGETFPNRFYQHAAQTDRDHNSEANSTHPTIWDQLSPIPNTDGVPTGGYYYRDSPFLALWGISTFDFKYQPFFHPFSPADASTAALSAGPDFVTACQQGALPNVCFIDPAFDDEGTGTSADDHPLADIRLGERSIADADHALADNGYLDNTVFVVTFDEWGGSYDHVPPPQVIDDTNAGADRIHLRPQSTHRSRRQPQEPGLVLRRTPLPNPVHPSAIPTSAQVIGPVISPPQETLTGVLAGTASFDPAAVCSATSVQSVSPAPVEPRHGNGQGQQGQQTTVAQSDALYGTAGMAGLAHNLKSRNV